MSVLSIVMAASGYLQSTESCLENPEKRKKGSIPKTFSSVTFRDDLHDVHFVVRPDVSGVALIVAVKPDGTFAAQFCEVGKPVKVLQTEREQVFAFLTPKGVVDDDCRLDSHSLVLLKELKGHGKSLEDLKKSLRRSDNNRLLVKDFQDNFPSRKQSCEDISLKDRSSTIYKRKLADTELQQEPPPSKRIRPWTPSREKQHLAEVEKAKKAAKDALLQEIESALAKIFKDKEDCVRELVVLAEAFIRSDDDNKSSYFSRAKTALGNGVVSQCAKMPPTKKGNERKRKTLKLFAEYFNTSPFEAQVRDFEKGICVVEPRFRRQLVKEYKNYLGTNGSGDSMENVTPEEEVKTTLSKVATLANNANLSSEVKRFIEEHFSFKIESPSPQCETPDMFKGEGCSLFLDSSLSFD